MKRLSEKWAYVWLWALGSVLLLTTSGCGYLIFSGKPTGARLNVHEENLAAFPTNIGLLEEGSQEAEPIILTVPPKVPRENDPKIIFWESPLLKTQEWASSG